MMKAVRSREKRVAIYYLMSTYSCTILKIKQQRRGRAAAAAAAAVPSSLLRRLALRLLLLWIVAGVCFHSGGFPFSSSSDRVFIVECAGNSVDGSSNRPLLLPIPRWSSTTATSSSSLRSSSSVYKSASDRSLPSPPHRGGQSSAFSIDWLIVAIIITELEIYSNCIELKG